MAKNKQEHIDWKLMFPLVFGTVLNPLNSTMLATALITICNNFARDASEGAMLVVPLYIAAAIGQPLMGRLADIYNPKRIFQVGLILVLLAAIVGMLAPAFSWLIVSRILLGLGTSAAYPTSMAILTHKYAQKNLPLPREVLGIMSVAGQVTLVIGPILGGFLTEFFGWKGIFMMNVPWVLGALYVSRSIDSIPKVQHEKVHVLKKIDAIGIAFFGIFLVTLLLTLAHQQFNYFYTGILLSALLLFVLWERKQSDPFINVRLLWNQPSLSMVYLRTLSTNYILYLVLYALPQWIEGVKMLTPGQTGLVTFPMSLFSTITALVISRKGKLIWVYVLSMISMMLACTGLFLLKPTIPIWSIIAITILFGTAIGINSIANQAALSEETTPKIAGISYGLYRTFSYIGAILSGTQLKAIFKGGITGDSLNNAGWHASFACFVLIALYAFFFIKRYGKQSISFKSS